MHVTTFIIELCKALAWPIVVLVLAVLFRAEVRLLLQRMRKGKVGLAEFEFEQGVASLRERVGPVEPTNRAVTDVAIAARVADDPRSTILAAWLEVQALVDAIVLRHATDDERRDPRSVSLRVLHRLLQDQPQSIDLYNDLRALRSQAVHDVAFAPRPSSVIEYVELSRELQGVLKPFAA